MKYSVKEAIFSGKDIIGYELIDELDQIKKAKLTDVVQLISKDLIDAEVIEDDNKQVHIVFKELPLNQESTLRLTAISRVIKDSKLDSYNCSDNMGRRVRVKPDKLWDYASIGAVSNVEAKMINDKRTLVGKGSSMAQLPVTES